MSEAWADEAVNALKIIFYAMAIFVTVSGLALSAGLSDFWQGVVLGALLTFLAMLIMCIYCAKRASSSA